MRKQVNDLNQNSCAPTLPSTTALPKRQDPDSLQNTSHLPGVFNLLFPFSSTQSTGLSSFRPNPKKSTYDQLLDEIHNCRQQIEKDIGDKRRRHLEQQKELEHLREESQRLENQIRQLQSQTTSNLESCFLRVQNEIQKLDYKLEEVLKKPTKPLIVEQHFT
jgi:septal ring factor EnvC (AmiA/AmiB activator)